MQHDSGMKLRHEISHDAPLADVFAMLSDPALPQAAATAVGVVISAEVSIGAKLESVIADLVAKGMDKEQGAGAVWLGGQR